MAFTVTYWARVNTADGTITGTGATSPDDPLLPTGATTVSADNHATIVAAEADGAQCRLINGVVRLLALPTPAAVDLSAVKLAAYGLIDAEAEKARAVFLTPGSGQSLEYERTGSDAQRLMDRVMVPVVGAAFVTLSRLRPVGQARPTPAGPVPRQAPAPLFDPADYPWLVAEQSALAAIGVSRSLVAVASAVLATRAEWDQAGASIKQIRRTAKLAVQSAATPDAVSAVLSGLSFPQLAALSRPGQMPGV